MLTQVQDIQHKFRSLIDDAFNQKIDFKTFWTFEMCFEHFLAEYFCVGNHQNTMTKLQGIMDDCKHKLEKCGIIINQYDSFLCNNNKKKFCMRMLNDMKWMDYNDWHKCNVKINQSIKNMNKTNKFQLIISDIFWVSHCKGADMSPDTLLKNNPETLHARLIFQFCWHHLFTSYGGADCNGDTPGNTGGKNHRFLDSMTQNNYPNRNLSYTKGLKWNNTVIKMTSNNVDINTAIRNPETNELTFTCLAMCFIFDIAFLFSIIYNKKELKQIQKQIILIINGFHGLDKNLLYGSRKIELHKLRIEANKIIEKTANLLMDHIVPRTESIIEVMDSSQMHQQKYKIQARIKTTKKIKRKDGSIYYISRGNKRKFKELNDVETQCINSNCNKRQRI